MRYKGFIKNTEADMIRIGILGSSFGEEHLGIYKSIEGAEVVSVFGRSEEKLARISAQHGVEVTRDVDSIINNKQIDLIDICLPTALHTEYIERAAAAGKSVICETPLCGGAEDLARIRKIAQGPQRLSVSAFMKYFAEYDYLRTAILDGSLGALRALHLKRQSAPVWGDLGLDRIVLNLMMHEIEYTAWLFGSPRALTVDEAYRGSERSLVRSSLQYDDKTVSVFASSMMPDNYPFTIGYEAYFDGGYLQFDCAFAGDTIEKRLRRHTAAGASDVEIAGEYPYRTMLADLVDCEQQGESSRMAVAHSIRAMDLALEINAKLA